MMRLVFGFLNLFQLHSKFLISLFYYQFLIETVDGAGGGCNLSKYTSIIFFLRKGLFNKSVLIV